MSEQETPQRQQLLANIATIIEYLERVPGVIKVEVEDPPLLGEYETYEKKVFVTFAGGLEYIVLEIY